MKQKKRSGFSRIGALLLVFILAVNLVMPSFAAGGVVFDDTKTIDTGILEYDYDKIPAYMLEENYALDALEYIGFDVQALKDNKVIYDPDYTGRHLAGKQYLLQEDPILTYIKYNDGGAHGGISKKAETAEELAATKTGYVPNIDVFYNGNDTYKAGMSCTSFVEYFVFGYLKHIVGKDTKYIETMHATALKRLADGTRTYPDTWTEMCEGEGGLISQGKVRHYSIELDESKDQTAEYNAIWRKISPGTIIRFGNDTSEYIHYAVYIGTYNNIHYVAHVGGGDRGPEIYIAELMATNNGPKSSFPIDFYDFRFVEENFGTIQIVKSDADDDTKLAGAYFVAVNQDTDEQYLIGPTNEKGYASLEDLPYDLDNGTTYTVCESIAPEGYALDPTIHTVTLSNDTPLITLYREIVNEKSFGALQIQKNTNTGNSKAGWQFNLYRLSPVYTTALSLDNSGQMYRVTVSDNQGNSVTSDAVSMTTTPLIILQQPANVVAEAGVKVSYTVIAQGDGLSYQWQYKNPGGEWTTSTSTDGLSPYYSYTMRADRDGRLSRCIITDQYSNSVTTDEVFMVLPTTLAIAADPVDATTAAGQTVTMSVTASGSNTSYQWQYSTDGVSWYNCNASNHSGCSGATATTMRFTANAAYNGRLYRCKVTDGTNTVYSGSAVSNIVAAIITSQPETQIAALGDSVTFSIGATGTNMTYVWQGKASGSGAWQSLGNGATYTTTLTEDNAGMEIRCVIVSNSLTTVSDSAYLGTSSTLLITSQPQNHVDEAGTYATFTVEAQGDGLTYVWETSTDGGKTWTRLTNPINDTPYVTDANGIVNIADLQTGDYFVQEINTGMDGWEYDLIAKPVTVTANHTAAAPAVVRFTNNELVGYGQIIKDTTNGGIKAGWQFRAWTDTAELGTYTTNAKGAIDLGALPAGTVVHIQEIGHATLTEDDLEYWSMDTAEKTLVIEAGQTKSVTFNNQWLGKGSLHKESNGTVEGWQFHVWTETADMGIHTTDKNGDIDLGLLEPGIYYLQEVGHATIEDLSLWFLDTSVKELTVVAGQSVSVLVQNTHGGDFDFTKIMDDGSSAAGWQFDIQDSAGNVTTHFTDENGKIYLTLLPGTYTITEVIPADKMYEPQGGSLSFEIEIKAGEILVKTFTNVPIRGDLYISKTDGKGNPVSNAGFVATGSDGKKYNFIESTTTPGLYELTNIPIDDYIITEEVVPPGFQVSGDNQWAVSLSKDHRTETLEIVNTQLGYGKIIKDTTNGGIKEGWQFRVWTDTAELGTYTTNVNGEIDLDDLIPGIYYVQEIGHKDMTPEQLAYWIMDTEVKTLVVEAGQTKSITFNNQWLGYGRVKKEMPDGGDLADWIFDVYRVSDNTYIGAFTSDVNGDIALGYLLPGDYRVIERVPESSLYRPVGGNEKILTVVAGEVSSITVRNTLRSGDITVNKVDGTTKAALAGAKFLLEWLDNDVWTPVVYSESIIPGGCRSEGLANGCLITGEDGTITFEGLHPDCEYRLTEVEPPAGYTLQAAPVFEGKLPADTLAFEQEVPNYSVFDLPSTGITFQLMPLFILMVSVVSLFMVMLVIAIKKGLLTEILQDIRK